MTTVFQLRVVTFFPNSFSRMRIESGVRMPGVSISTLHTSPSVTRMMRKSFSGVS